MTEYSRNEVGRRTLTGCVVILFLASASILAVEMSASQKKKDDSSVSVGKTAGIGALLGLALGRSVGDVVGGAALGAAGGMIANEVMKDRSPQEEANQAAPPAEQEKQRLAEAKAQEKAQAELEEAIGEDTLAGYEALRACQYERAYALAKVGATSENSDHRLASLWLEAMIAVDQRDSARAEEFQKQVAERDPEIDSLQQASIATDQAVLDLRTERRELVMPSCRN